MPTHDAESKSDEGFEPDESMSEESAPQATPDPRTQKALAWVTRFSPIWIPFFFSFLLQLLIAFRVDRAAPGTFGILGNAYLMQAAFSFCAAGIVGVLGSLALVATWKRAPEKVDVARRWIIGAELIGVMLLSIVYWYWVLLGYTGACIMRQERTTADNLSTFIKQAGIVYPPARAYWFNQLATAVADSPDHDLYVDQALQAAREDYPKNSPQYLSLLIDQGVACRYQNKNQRSELLLNEALKVLESQEPKDYESLARCYDSIGVTHLQTRDFDGAAAYLDKATKIMDKCSIPVQAEIANDTLGCFDQWGKLDLAEEPLKKLQTFLANNSNKIGPAEQARYCANIGLHQADTKNFADARKSFNKALELLRWQAPGLKSAIARNLAHLADVTAAEGDLAAAEKQYKESLRLDSSNIACLGLAHVYDLQKRYTEADFLYARAEDNQPQNSRGGSVISGQRLARLVSLAPLEHRKFVLEKIHGPRELLEPDPKISFCRGQTFHVIDTRPVVRDFRRSGESGIEVVSGEALREAFAHIPSDKALATFQWSKSYLPEPGKLKRELISDAALPGTVLLPRSLRDFLFQEVVIMSTADYEKLKALAPITHKTTGQTNAWVITIPHIPANESLFRRQVDLARETSPDNSQWLSLSLKALGDFYFDMSEFKKAESAYLDSINSTEKREGKASVALVPVLESAGWLYTNMDDFDKAQSSFTRAIGICRKSNRLSGVIGFEYVDLLEKNGKEIEARNVLTMLDADRQSVLFEEIVLPGHESSSKPPLDPVILQESPSLSPTELPVEHGKPIVLMASKLRRTISDPKGWSLIPTMSEQINTPKPTVDLGRTVVMLSQATFTKLAAFIKEPAKQPH